MNIVSTDFEVNYYYTYKKYDRYHNCYYDLHNADITNQLVIKDKDIAFNCIYQSGESYMYGDYNHPSPDFELSSQSDSFFVETIF